ncbi:hypothetical protein E4U57_004595 [Claviceps arundinis]|uniref:Carboxylic ester hydrolase n=1 Tax=Claviceps arundinis TaxID=1623583 RepID=A0A9P7MUH0_9HYPO|nr:hypothetical protein E4U57_004595 [Claviceps arundinis]KAG5970407.1 hypothetical protein E4U56_007738 [Claviceps arundinis]
MKLWIAVTSLCAAIVLATPAPAPPVNPIPDQTPPEAILEERFATVDVDLPSGGTITGRSILNVESFNAIPYADPPIGPLRLKPPKKFSGTFGKRDGTGIAPACPQMLISRESLGVIGAVFNDVLKIPLLQSLGGQEDCLTVNVQRPANTKPNAKLPVLFWIFGGGFEFGGTNTYDATSLLATAVSQKQPFIFVAVNYRVAGFGFLPGKEILADGSANIGLLDQRMGLEWVADNIAAFGGDPSKVTIWGESAGAISVFNQMALYDGNALYKGQPLFRGAIMNSGSIAPASPVDCPKGQLVYDTVVNKTGCHGTSDTLACLRRADYTTFLDAVNSLPGIISHSTLALSYLPRPDGKILTQSPDKLARLGKYHPVPMIIGSQEDEGTLFAILTPDLTSPAKVVNYLSTNFFHGASKDQLQTLVQLYEPGILQGSPFRTGLLNELYPGFKRLAALFGDVTFTLARRITLQHAAAAHPSVPTWSYMASYNYGLPFLGTFHASDILQVFMGLLPNYATKSCRTYYLNFVHNLDPNQGEGGYAHWPMWKEARKLMWFRWGFGNDVLGDDFRDKAFDYLLASGESLYI